MPDPIHVPDFRFIGKAYPEVRSKTGLRVCTIGYSMHYNRLLRFPELPPSASPRVARWTAVQGMFDRGEDGRSGTIYPAGPVTYATPKTITAKAGFDQVASFARDGHNAMVALRESMGVVRPLGIRAKWTERGQTPGEDGLVGQPQRLRVLYETEDGRSHDQTVLDWQFYQAVKSFASRYDNPYEEAIKRLESPDYEHLFVCGNIAQHPTSFVVVAHLCRKKP